MSDVVARTSEWIAKWNGAGQEDCRRFLSGLSPVESEDEDAAAMVWETLHFAALPMLGGSANIGGSTLVALAESLLRALPSSSQDPTPSAESARALSDHLIDAVWSADAALDEQISDITTRTTALKVDGESEEGAAEKDAEKTEWENKAQALKTRLEKDKETLVEVVKGYMRIGAVDPIQARERLDLALIISSGLIANKANYDRREIRTRTGLFYKQIKFNLSREQSEGFSKLLTELTGSLPPAHSTSTGRPLESTASMLEQAAPVWDHLFSVIGYFEMDPNRALDIILDVFSTHVATHWSFFLALLSHSPWKGNSSRLHWTSEVEAHEQPALAAAEGRYRGKSIDEVLLEAEGDRAPPPPPAEDEVEPQARVMAQILGFKFRHYQNPETKETTPNTLYSMAALLIREGFIGLDELYPHLSPSDEDMEEEDHQAYNESVEKRKSAGTVNKLAMTGALEGGGSTPKPRAPEQKKTPDEKKTAASNQKVGIVTALLAVGALRPALSMLCKFPWLKDAHPEISDVLLRIMTHSLSDLYDQRNPPKIPNKASYTQARARYGAAGPQPAPPRRKVLSLIAPAPPFTNNTEFVFFFPDWTERVPTCASEEDFEDVIEPLMAFVGFHISRDLMFMMKFTRLGKKQLQDTLGDPLVKKPTAPDYSNPVVSFWTRAIRLYLLPALSLVRGNAVCCVDVWGILRFFDAAERWRFYGEWNTTIYASSGELQVRRRQVERESKAIMRRLSLETVDSLQTSMAKLAHSNPCIIFSIAVNQAMAYPNMAEVVIKSLKFVLNMGFDVLVFTVISILANPGGRERYKPDGVNASDWLQNLAKFIGMMLARYTVDPSTLLQYVMHQFTNDVISEVIIVRELIERMSYIEPLPSLSDTQIRVMSGGPLLRIEAVASRTRGARSDPQDQTSRAPARLVRHLLDSGMARPLLIQVAKLRQEAAKNTKNTQLKSVASLFDNVHGVFLQYLELVQSTGLISVEQYAKEIAPPLAELGDLYDISAPMCMQIFRPLLTAAVKETASEYQRREKWENEQAERRLAELLKAREEKKSKETTPSPATTSDNIAAQAKTNGDASTPTLKPADSDVDMAPVEPAPPPPKYTGPWLPRLEAFFGDVEKVVPQTVLDTLGPGFYITFWQMTTSDLGVPDDKYHEEVKNLNAYADEEHKEYLRKERIRSMRSEANGHWMREKRAKEYIEQLKQEVNVQIDARQFTIKRLAKESSVWFASDKKPAIIAGIAVEHCLLPRALLSPMDAEYAAQMIKAMHALGTPNWHTLKVYDLLLGEQIRAMVFSCSEYEARNYGRFLCAILKHLNAWYDDKNEYDKGQTKTVNGRIIAHLHGMSRTCKAVPADQSEYTPWADFQKLVRKWHRNVSVCLKDLIQTDEYMRVYNAMIILKEILPVFPLMSVSSDLGPRVELPVKALLDKEMAMPPQERRNDLMTVAGAYHSALHKRESYWMPKAPTKPRDSMSRATSSTKPLPTAPANGTPKPQPSSSTPTHPQAATNGEKATATPPPARPIDAVPRPEVVRRVQRPDTPSQPAGNGSGRPANLVNAGPNPIPPRPQTQMPPTRPARDAIRPMGPSRLDIRNDTRMDTRPDSPAVPPPMLRTPSGNGREPGRPIPNLTAPLPLAPHRQQQLSPRSRLPELRRDGPGMPPPMAPSQTPSAQELRETARQTMTRKAEEQAADERLARVPPTEPRHGNSRAPSPSTRRRSVSPPTQPGTRNGSMDSRGSGGRARDTERGEERIGDHDTRAPDRRDRRERTTTREAEREKDRGRDRHGERERKDREREVREKERGERDREGHRAERHRREEKERDVTGRSVPPDAPRRDRVPTDPNTSDDTPGVKRRRAPDEEPDRATKRTKEKEKRDRDRTRRTTAEDKEHDRPRRRERDGVDVDKTGPPLPSSTPSAPRAMAAGESSRRPSIDISGRDRERMPRDMRDNGGPPPSPHLGAEQSSLLSRISTNRGNEQRIPQGPRSGVEPPRDYNRGEPSQARRNEGPGLRADGPAFRSDAIDRRDMGRRAPPGGPRLNDVFDLPPHRQGPSGDRARMEEQEIRRKRTIADRERDSPVADPSINSPEPGQQSKKTRVRIDRTRALGRG
ncbi:hypothetical protein PENSPDRAFT_733684 [Peniophora sp. CONT]|nr:hypothetical protein PENSPDRAFT_733684 [Peniophora sp. CONT]